MSDKDYSGCEYHKIEYDQNFCSEYEMFCDERKDCYYKQLQACQEQVATKSDECEELKSTIGYYITKTGQILADTDAMTDQFHKIEQENTTLKQQLDSAVEALEKIESLEISQEKYLGNSIQLNKAKSIAKTVLDKIKEN